MGMNLKPVDFNAVAKQGQYVYCYLRKDGSPYYVGISGRSARPTVKHRTNRGGVQVPRDRSRIRVLRSGLTREEACEWEMFNIQQYGRKDIGAGILRNRTDGGDNGGLGHRHSEEHKAYIASVHRGRKAGPETREKLRAHAARPEHIARMLKQCFTPEAIEKSAAKRRGVKFDEERCGNISAGKVEGAGYAEECGFTTEEWLELNDNQRRSIRERVGEGWTDRKTLLLPSHIRLDVLRTSATYGVDPIWYSGLGKNKHTDLRKRHNNWKQSGEPKGVSWETWKDLPRNQCNSIARCVGTPWLNYGITLEQYFAQGKAPKNKLQWRYKNGKRGAELLEGISLIAP